MRNKLLPLMASGLLFSSSLFAFDSFVIRDVRVDGLERISEGTVLNYLPVKVGDVVTASESSKIIKALFKTGFFDDVQLLEEKGVLVVKIAERPAIGQINIRGNRDIDTDDLRKALKLAGLAEGRTFDRALLDQVELELQRQYFSRGKYAVKVEAKVVEQPRNRVAVDIDIHEGKAAKIRDINIVGNDVYPDKKLHEQMQLSTTNWLSWFNHDDQYAKQKLAGDRETIRSYYLDRGYLDFDLRSTQVEITPEKEDIYITLNLHEGQRYRIEEVMLEGDTIVPRAELMPLVAVKPGDIFSRQQVTSTMTAITDRLGEEGYAFARVIPETEQVGDSDKVLLKLTVEPGQRYYARRIRFEGNHKTQDVVLRREISQFEGAWVSSKRIKDSQSNLNRTGYFSDVQVDVQPVPGSDDQVDIVYRVEEAASGQLSGSIGYSDLDGLLFQFSVNNRNFMGTGNSLDFVFNNSRASTTYSVNFVDPFYTAHGISRGINLYFNETDLSHTTSIADYATNNLGGNVDFGIPISEATRFNVGFGYQATKLSVNRDTAPNEIIGFLDENGKGYDEYTLSLGWSYNSLDKYIFPEKGIRYSASVFSAVPGSDLQYYRAVVEGQWYQPLYAGYIFNFGANVGYGDGYGNTDSLPFYKHFYAGGARSVRGYGENSLGPKDSQDNPFGGNLKVESSANVIIPNYFDLESKSVRIQAFMDAGQVYDTSNTRRVKNNQYAGIDNPDNLRYSAGVSFTWMSPLAPLVFSYAIPLNKKSGDEEQRFAFTFGTFF